MSSIESDELFARRLQAQELGIRSHPTSETPLMEENRNPTVINARFNEISSSRATVIAISSMHIPQIIAAAFVLGLHWSDTSPCDNSHRERWKWWCLISAIRMLIYTTILIGMHTTRTYLEANPTQMAKIASVRNIVDAAGLIWFVIGNMWLFTEDFNCSNPWGSPVYVYCVIMIIINYIQICLPCIIAILLIPVFCFCMPCLIRLLARMQDAAAPKGATEAAIEALEQVTIQASDLGQGRENTCPICLNDMAVGEKVRILPCKHMFHSQCVDEWLRVNASCPTCRTSILRDEEAHDHDEHKESSSLTSESSVPRRSGSGMEIDRWNRF